MGNIKKWVLFVPLSAILFSVSSPAFSVSAASDFDNTVQITDKLELYEKDTSISDVTTTYLTRYQDDPAQFTCGVDKTADIQSLIDTAVNNDGHYAVVQVYDGGLPAPYFKIIWDTNYTNPTSSLIFNNIGGNNALTVPTGATGINVMEFYYRSAWGIGGTMGSACNTSASRIISSDPLKHTATGRQYKIFQNTFPVNAYPAGYEGIEVPTEVIEPMTPYFNWYVDNTNKLTTRYASNLPDDNTPDLWKFTVYEADSSFVQGDFLSEMSVSTYETYEFDLPSDGNYLLIVENADEDYNNVSTITFKITADSTFRTSNNLNQTNCMNNVCEPDNIPILEDCMTDTFPYLDFNGCMNNLGRIVNLLSFDTLKFSNNWEYLNCEDFHVIDTWLPKVFDPYEAYCPIWPKDIRDMITPFVTFLLGLVMVRFLTRQGGDGF